MAAICLAGLSRARIKHLIHNQPNAPIVIAGDDLHRRNLRTPAPGILQRVGSNELHALRFGLQKRNRTRFIRRWAVEGHCENKSVDLALDNAARIRNAPILDEAGIGLVHRIETEPHSYEHAHREQAHERDRDQNLDQCHAGFGMVFHGPAGVGMRAPR